MRSLKLQITLITLLVPLFLMSSPTDALAVVQTLNSQTGQNQTFQNDSNVTISSASNVHTLGWNGLLPVSRGGTGAGSFTNGSIFFFNGSVFAQDNSNFFWDNTNKRLGIGTNSPTAALSVSGSATVSGNLDVTGSISAANFDLADFVPYTGATDDVDLGPNSLSTNSIATTEDSIINTLTVGLGGSSLSANTALGRDVLVSNSTGDGNTGAGYLSLHENTTGVENTAFGQQALYQNTTGSTNVSIGSSSLIAASTADNNVAIGWRSMGATTTGSSNTAVGSRSLWFNTTGTDNIAIGGVAAINQADGSSALTTANRSIYIGNGVKGYDNNDDNSIVIGYDAIGAGANKTVIGNSSMTDVYFGSSDANADIHATKLFLGSSSVPGCIIMGDTSGGVGYITLDNGSLTVSSSPPTACQ